MRSKLLKKASSELLRVTMLQGFQKALPQVCEDIMGKGTLEESKYSNGSTDWTIVVYNSKKLSESEFEDMLREKLNFGGYIKVEPATYSSDHEAAAKPKFEVGDIVATDKWSPQYEVLEVLSDGKLRLKPLSGDLGTFNQHSQGLTVVKPKNPVPIEYKSRPSDFDRAKPYIKKIVDRLDSTAADIANEVYSQFKPDFEDAMSDVQQDPDVDNAIQDAINDAISDSFSDFKVPTDLEDIVRKECLTRLHFPGGRVEAPKMVNVEDLKPKSSAFRKYSEETEIAMADFVADNEGLTLDYDELFERFQSYLPSVTKEDLEDITSALSNSGYVTALGAGEWKIN
jgi:hypothetical protein